MELMSIYMNGEGLPFILPEMMKADHCYRLQYINYFGETHAENKFQVLELRFIYFWSDNADRRHAIFRNLLTEEPCMIPLFRIQNVVEIHIS